MLLIKNCRLIDSVAIWEENRDILIEDGKIVKIEEEIDSSSIEGVEIVDAEGKLVTPGIVESHCHLGVYDTAVPEGIDGNERSNPVLPGLRGIDALNLIDPIYNVCLKNGVTTVVTGPGSANLMGGSFVALKTAGESLDERIIEEEVSIKIALGENPKSNYGGKGKAPQTRMMSAAMFREALFGAKEYYDKYKEKEEGKAKEGPAFDLNKHSLMRVFDGMRLKIHAHQADDIMTGVRVCEEFNIRYTIEHCTGGANIIDKLEDHKVDCIIGPSAGGKGKYELKDKGFELGRLLEERDMDFAIITDHPVVPIEGLLMQVIQYIKAGLSREAALKAITINAAKLTDIEDRVGSIEVGKDADIVIWNEGPFETMSEVNTVFVEGKKAYTREDKEYDFDYKEC